MKIIKWRDSFNIGVETMDLQHKTIIELINKLYNVIKNQAGAATADEILSDMINYGEKHLQDEELLLNKYQYPTRENHIAIHQQYRDKIDSLLEKIGPLDENDIQDIYIFLRQWWTEHIMIDDQKYSAFITEQMKEN